MTHANGRNELSTVRRAAVVLAIFLILAASSRAAEVQPVLTGDTRIHDPSVVEVDGRFVAFGTGEQGPSHGAIRVKTSPDGIAWKDAGVIGKGAPQWATEALGFQPTNVWAPSASLRDGAARLYYALSSFGSNTSAIGLMTSNRFDPSKPSEGWVDQGIVLKSGAQDDYNAIDPFRIDLADGRAFLAFGSFWSGIKLAELDPASGKLRDAKATPIALASRNGGAIEAPALIEHGGKFYLFVSFDQCCKGVASTYSIRVGRADRIEGPYVDREGRPMLDGGGSIVQGTSGRVIGPCGQEPVRTERGDMLAFHYYDGAKGGVPTLQLSPIGWTPDGWPQLDPLSPSRRRPR